MNYEGYFFTLQFGSSDQYANGTQLLKNAFPERSWSLKPLFLYFLSLQLLVKIASNFFAFRLIAFSFEFYL